MKLTGTLLSLVGASCVGALALTAPAYARAKPCCYNNGDFFNTSTSTCRNYGGRVVEQQYCTGGDDYYGGDDRYQGDYGPAYGNGDASFSIRFGNVVFGYSDGYYDRDRRWHRWRNHNERNWYRQHHRTSYYHMDRARDRDRYRRDWRDGRRDDWYDDDRR